MGQQEIIDVLKKEGRPLSRGQIAKKLGERDVKVSLRIRKLLKSNDIKCFELDRFQASEYSEDKKLCRRTRFYYVCMESGKVI